MSFKKKVSFAGSKLALFAAAVWIWQLPLRTVDERQNGVDETTRAHLEECRERIAKVLNASMQVND